MTNRKTYTTAFSFHYPRFTRTLFLPTNKSSFGLIYHGECTTSRPLLRNLDTISYKYMYTPMPLWITSADLGAISERTCHCFVSRLNSTNNHAWICNFTLTSFLERNFPRNNPRLLFFFIVGCCDGVCITLRNTLKCVLSAGHMTVLQSRYQG
jgi:hypothetical protein